MIKNNDLGKEFYEWLIHPVDKVKLIDFDDINRNDFALVCELPFGATSEGSFRPDITLLINGMPLAFLEVKKPNNEGGIQVEFKRMINDRFEKVEHKKYFDYFVYTPILVFNTKSFVNTIINVNLLGGIIIIMRDQKGVRPGR